MLVGVLSDTHDNLPMIERATACLRARGVELLLHAGDYVSPFALKLIMRAGIPLIGVFGNNDGEKPGLQSVTADIFDGPHRFELDGRTILMAHDAGALVRAMTPDVVLAIWGHTHKPEVGAGPVLRVNPGEAGGWLSGRATGAIVDLKKLLAEIIEFGRQEGPRI